MCPEQIAGKHPGDLLFRIKRHVEKENRLGAGGDLQHFLPDGISHRNSPGCFGVGDHLAPMVAEHAFRSRKRREHRFRAAAETSKEMRLDEARVYAQVRFQDVTVHPHRIAARSRAKRG